MLGNIDRYSNLYFRMLLISRFNYSNINQLVKIKCCKVISLVPPSHYSIIVLAYILGFGLWPKVNIIHKKRWGKGGKYSLLLLSMIIHSWMYELFGTLHFWKAFNFYYPCIDAADPKADFVFLIKGINRCTTVYSAPYLLEGVIEVSQIIGIKKVFRGLTNEWVVKFLFSSTKSRNLAEHTVAIRNVGFAATNIRPIVSLFDKKTS